LMLMASGLGVPSPIRDFIPFRQDRSVAKAM
jgi:hypothetical protein